MRSVFVCVLLTACVFAVDNLPRHGVIGLQLGKSDPAKASGPSNPVVVQRVAQNSAGAEAGFLAGDIVRSVDGSPAVSPTRAARMVSRHLAGDQVHIAVTRGAQELNLTATLKPRPFESRPDADVLYWSVNVGSARRRVIVTRPHRNGRLPAILLMQGLGCDSMDGLNSQTGYGAVLAAFEGLGFVTMRLEKTGVGDSEGPDCTDPAATPDLEAEGYLAGLRALKSYDFVDPAKVFVFAHSMGPVVGSLAIAREPVRGFIAVETVGTDWFEYDLERYRVQHSLGAPPDKVDSDLRAYEICSYRFYVEKQRPEDLAKTLGCDIMTAPFGDVPYTFMQAVADISLGRQWKNADFPVLIIYGTSSPVTTSHQSRALVSLINRLHPGRATYAEIPHMSHDLSLYDSPADFMNRAPGSVHPFSAELMEAIMSWMKPLLG
ncbi:MAG: alpha/beta fold hydrolase [Bryobacteraceae bacterium]|jgi:pimeloyl-ACP methyl ester carboxylesterase